MTMMLMASREARSFPRGWEHPRKDGHYVGLYPNDALDWEPDDECPITAADCMPSVGGMDDAETQIAAYETVSEGTPMSPAFDNSPSGRLELLQWCADNASVPGFRDKRTSIEAWAAMLFGAGMVNIHTGDVEAR